MNVKVTRIGDKLAVVLPDDVAAELGAVDGGTLALEETTRGYTLGHAVRDGVRPEVMDAHRESVEQYGDLYRKLADHEDDGVSPEVGKIIDGIITRYDKTLRILAK